MLDPESSIGIRLLSLSADSLLMHVADESGIPSSAADRIVDRAMRAGMHTATSDAAGLAAAHEALSRRGEVRRKDIESIIRQWQARAKGAAHWRSTP